jgi:hypothetical protein
MPNENINAHNYTESSNNFPHICNKLLTDAFKIIAINGRFNLI